MLTRTQWRNYMPGFFEAAANFKQPAKKPITATIAGTVITVTLEQKKRNNAVG